jgi:hypothetical protein
MFHVEHIDLCFGKQEGHVLWAELHSSQVIL